jgi:hypothetical protein
MINGPRDMFDWHQLTLPWEMAVIAMMRVIVYNEPYSWILAILQHDSCFFRNYDETRARTTVLLLLLLLLSIMRILMDHRHHHHQRRRRRSQRQQQHLSFLIPLLPLHWNMKMIIDILLLPPTIHPTTDRMLQYHSLLSRKQKYSTTTTTTTTTTAVAPAVTVAATMRIPLWATGTLIRHVRHRINQILLLAQLGFR